VLTHHFAPAFGSVDVEQSDGCRACCLSSKAEASDTTTTSNQEHRGEAAPVSRRRPGRIHSRDRPCAVSSPAGGTSCDAGVATYCSVQILLGLYCRLS
jgi:hypothetical protein